MGESGAGLTLCVDKLSCAHIGWLARGVTGWTFGSKCLKILQVILFQGSNHNVIKTVVHFVSVLVTR